jgi:DUF1680 family protein
MADVAALTGDERYLDAITKIWNNVVDTKLHLTGGCGARAAGEAYGNDYELPHRCYNETCAAVAFLFWNHRMFLMTGDAKYMDVFERSLYNGVLSGVSLSGDRFFYPNPLEYDGKPRTTTAMPAARRGLAAPAVRRMCCARSPRSAATVAAVRGDRLFVHPLRRTAAHRPRSARRRCASTRSTRYPWEGDVTLRVQASKAATFTLCLRIPGWVERSIRSPATCIHIRRSLARRLVPPSQW